MEDAAPPIKRRFLTVVKNVVVREDLRELLLGIGDVEVHSRTDLNGLWRATYDAAFFDLPISDLLHHADVRALSANGTAIVVLDGHLPPGSHAGSGVEVLEQPFRTVDVHALLKRIGMLI